MKLDVGPLLDVVNVLDRPRLTLECPLCGTRRQLSDAQAEGAEGVSCPTDDCGFALSPVDLWGAFLARRS